MKIEPVPEQFQSRTYQFQSRTYGNYPGYSNIDFENWFRKTTNENELPDGRVYLPVMWTAYQVKNLGTRSIQRYVDSLAREKRYFTIHQHDDGCLVNFKDLNILCFGMSGFESDIPIPLVGETPPRVPQQERIILASFIGNKTHQIRKKMFNLFQSVPGFHVSENRTDIIPYLENIAQSIFGLCPRGYGRTSFRIQECASCGTIPVYISDKFWIPFNEDFNKYGVLISEEELPNMETILRSFSPKQIEQKQEKLKEVLLSIYNYSAVKHRILNILQENKDSVAIPYRSRPYHGDRQKLFKSQMKPQLLL